MVLIISQPQEPSTDKVIDWLYNNGVDFLRIDGGELLSRGFPVTLRIDDSAFVFRIDDQREFNFNNIVSVWYRRDSSYNVKINKLLRLSEEPYYDEILRNLNNEHLAAKKALYACISMSKKILGNFEKSAVNKVEMLALARQAGMDVPVTLITSNKEELKAFVKKHGGVITKAIWEGVGFSVSNDKTTESFLNFTEVVSEEFIENISDTFYYSLFQEKLEKALDIRTFYLNGEFYSMAIFSQLDNQTKTDFRKYSNNRNVPYKLPQQIEERIHKFMTTINLNTGSIDIVKTKCGKFVFLEVNPVGQYDMTSAPCNYHLDKKIAEFLINKNKNGQ
jgi:ATP-GRASP peptide maturase of grasp-with-spasm system